MVAKAEIIRNFPPRLQGYIDKVAKGLKLPVVVRYNPFFGIKSDPMQVMATLKPEIMTASSVVAVELNPAFKTFAYDGQGEMTGEGEYIIGHEVTHAVIHKDGFDLNDIYFSLEKRKGLDMPTAEYLQQALFDSGRAKNIHTFALNMALHLRLNVDLAKAGFNIETEYSMPFLEMIDLNHGSLTELAAFHGLPSYVPLQLARTLSFDSLTLVAERFLYLSKDNRDVFMKKIGAFWQSELLRFVKYLGFDGRDSSYFTGDEFAGFYTNSARIELMKTMYAYLCSGSKYLTYSYFEKAEFQGRVFSSAKQYVEEGDLYSALNILLCIVGSPEAGKPINWLISNLLQEAKEKTGEKDKVKLIEHLRDECIKRGHELAAFVIQNDLFQMAENGSG